jgi:hypothetical protein
MKATRANSFFIGLIGVGLSLAIGLSDAKLWLHNFSTWQANAVELSVSRKQTIKTTNPTSREKQNSRRAGKKEVKDLRFDQPGEAAEFFRLKRLPAGAKELPLEHYAGARTQMQRMRSYSTALGGYLPSDAHQPQAIGTWVSLGPGNIGGRTRSILIHPMAPSTMYAGGVSGGVWKTTDGGQSWLPVGDSMANIAIGSMAMDPANPNVIYAGTGESYVNGIRGLGIFKTTDGGVTWTHLASTNNNANFHYVNDLVVSPVNSQRVYAATRTGVWRSLDGGMNWAQVHGAASNNGCQDMAVRTDRATDYLFASCSNNGLATIYRNTDAAGAGVWENVHTEANMGRASLAIAPSNQEVIYALSTSLYFNQADPNDPLNAYRNALHAVFRSTSGGAAGSWMAQVRNTSAAKFNTIQ